MMAATLGRKSAAPPIKFSRMIVLRIVREKKFHATSVLMNSPRGNDVCC
jgi:hypothetical protein